MVSIVAVILMLLGAPLVWAFPSNATLSALAANTAINLGTFTNDPVGCGPAAISVLDYGGFQYDSTHHQLLLNGGGHAATGRDDTLTFSFTTLIWSALAAGVYPGGSTLPAQMTSGNLNLTTGFYATSGNPVSNHTKDLLIWAPNVQRSVLLNGYGPHGCASPNYSERQIAHYDPTTMLWTSISGTSTGTWLSLDEIPAAEYDPPSGLILIVSRSGAWTYNPTTNAVVKILTYSVSAMGYLNTLVYFPKTQTHYLLTRNSPIQVWEITPNRTTWSSTTRVQVTGMTGTPNSNGANESPGWAVDTLNDVICGDITSGQIKCFNPVTKVWTTTTITISGGGGPIGHQKAKGIAFDPVDNVFIFMTDQASGSKTWAYRGALPSSIPPPPNNLTVASVQP